MASKDQDLKAKHLIIASLLLAALLFASYYYSSFQSEEKPQPIEPNIPELAEPEIPTEPEETPAEPEIPTEPEEIPTEPEEPPETLVRIENFKFIPREINITVGETVVWKNLDVFMGDIRPHVVAAHFREFRSPRLLINDTFSHTFTKIGRFTYNDAVFPSKMTIGVINVVGDLEMAAITGKAIDFNKETTSVGLIMLLLVIVFIGLYNENKLHLIMPHKK